VLRLSDIQLKRSKREIEIYKGKIRLQGTTYTRFQYMVMWAATYLR